jgi:hypothetical protein
MLTETRCRVLLPERITREKSKWTEHNFLFIVKNYLITRYPNYKFIREEDGFAICDRIDDVEERRKKR